MTPGDPGLLARRLGALETSADGALATLGRIEALTGHGRDIVNLAIGDPDFPTPSHITEAAVEAIAAGHTHYPPAPGLPELRQAIGRHVGATRRIPVDPDQVVVTPGSKPVMFYTVLALGEPGVEIICPDPGMPEFEAVAGFTGATVVPMRLDPGTHRPDLDDLARRVTPRTRLLMLISPHNPTGAVLTAEELATIAALVRERRCYVFSDEIYSAIRFDGPHRSIASLPGMAERTIVADGFSKTYAMTGWRLGYGVFPVPLVPTVVRLQRNSVSAAAAFTQWAGVAALEGPQDCVAAMVAEYRRRRDLVVQAVRQSAGGLTCVEPQGGLYAFPDIRGTGLTSAELAERAVDEAGVAVLPGTAFGARGEGHVRLAYTVPLPRLAEGLARFQEAIRRATATARRSPGSRGA